MLVSMVTTNVWHCLTNALHLMKAEYYLEHTIYCLCLYVSGKNGCSSSKMPKDRFGYPTHFGWHGYKENETF